MSKIRVYTAILLVVIILFTSAVTFAQGGQNGTESNNTVYGGPNGTGSAPSQTKPASYYISFIFSLPINGLANAILGLSKITGFYTVEQLVFSDDNSSPKTAYVFTSGEWDNVIMPWYRLAFAIASLGVVYQIVMLWVGYRTIAASINPQKAAGMQETMWNIVLAILFLSQMPLFAKFIFQANAVFVTAIKGTLVKYRLYETAIGSISESMILDTGDPLMNSLVRLGFAGLMLTLNFLYMVRKFVLGVLIVASPVVAWSMLSSRKTPMMLLLSEIVSNGFMSASHAIVLAFYASMTNYSEDGMFSSWWAKLFALSLLIPVSAFLRRLITGWLNLIGVDEEKYAGMAMIGVGSLVATGAILRETLGRSRGKNAHQPPQPREKRDGFGEPMSGSPVGGSPISRAPFSGFTGSGSAGGTAAGFLSPGYSGIGGASESSGIKSADIESSDIDAGNIVKEDFPTGIPLPVEKTEDDLHYTVLTPEEKARANFARTTGLFGNAPSFKPHETPKINEYQDRKTNIKIDDNTFLGPIGPSIQSYESIKSTKPEQQKSWPTLEKAIRAGKAALPVAARIGGAVVVAGGTALGLAAGTAFGLPTGNVKSFQIAGAELGKGSAHALGYAARKTIDIGKAVRQAGRNKNISSLDKPSLK